MKIQLPWGSENLELKLPDGWNLLFPEKAPGGITEKKVTKAQEQEAVKLALKRPIGASPLEKTGFRGKRILIIVDDNTRPTPIDRFFHIILDVLKKAGANFKNITVMPALGIHTRMSADEMARKIGAENFKKTNWVNHNASDVVELQYFGQTSRGIRVELNKEISRSDFVITLGLVEPHLWAGFGGGMKNILPGIASTQTISNHHSIIAEPPYLFNRVGMSPDMNSFRLDLEEVKSMLPAPVFCVNVVLNSEKKIIGAFAGDPISAHREAVRFNIKISGLYLDRQVDGVIVNSHPMDFNFKQSMKGVGNSIPALKPGGVVMGFLRAQRGLDDITPPEDYKPLWLVKGLLRMLGPSRVLWLLEKTKKGLNEEEKFLVYYSMQLIRAYDLFFHVPTLTDDEIKRLGFFENYRDPQDLINSASRKLGDGATVAVFPEAGATFPVIRTAL